MQTTATTNAADVTAAENEWTPIGHYYEPIAYFNGAVLKYRGIACQMNRAHMMSQPGMLMLDSYKGDRITADTHEVVRAV